MTQDGNVIPQGGWQRVLGTILMAFGLFATLAATPFNGAGDVGTACFAFGGPLLFWGFMLLYFSILERKIGLVLQRQDERPDHPTQGTGKAT